PRPPGVLEDLVVEPGRHHERHGVEPPVDVAVDRRPGVLALDRRPTVRGLHARPNVGNAVDPHQAVRTRSRRAEQPSGTVVLERAPRDRHAGGRQRGADGVALEAADRPALEIERDGSIPPDRLVVTLGQAPAHPEATAPSAGRYVLRISFVPVWRS